MLGILVCMDMGWGCGVVTSQVHLNWFNNVELNLMFVQRLRFVKLTVFLIK